MPSSQTLGQFIKRLRSAAGLNQRALSERLGVDATYLSHLEADRREPSLQLLRRLASELNVPPGLLLALALWTDLPPENQEPYKELMERLIQLATVSQFKLGGQ
ncbi:MAG: helix-turn-helix transcriptional regulator [Gemmatimonadetes bacterium]|nr:helix-turn-helix transcriptional regulator [Gemmatimonadota bacterium]